MIMVYHNHNLSSLFLLKISFLVAFIQTYFLTTSPALFCASFEEEKICLVPVGGFNSADNHHFWILQPVLTYSDMN